MKRKRGAGRTRSWGATALVALSLCAGLYAGSAVALELSKIESQSALGEPLDLRLSATDLGPDPDAVRIRIASPAAYRRAGLARPSLLASAGVEVLSWGERAQIRVRSVEPAQEPLMALLLETSDGHGVALHEYTLLLVAPVAEFFRAAPAALPAAAVAARPLQTARPGAGVVGPAQALQVSAAMAAARRPTTVSSGVASTPLSRPLQLRWINRLTLPTPRYSQPMPSNLRLIERISPPKLKELAATSILPAAQAADPAGPSAGMVTLAWWWWLLPLLVIALLLIARRRAGRERRPLVPTRPATRPRPLPPAPPPPPVLREVREVPTAPLANPPDFHNEVTRLLRDALRRSPQRLDLRYKLIEVSYAAGRKDEFLENARQYADQVRGQHDPTWPAIVKMGLSLLPDEPLFTTQQDDHQPARSVRHYDGLDSAGLNEALAEVQDGYTRLASNKVFLKALNGIHQREGGRPTTLAHALRLSQEVGGAQIVIKREDLRPARESHHINAHGQVLLARQMGRKRVIAATRSGAHGEAVAMAGRALGMPVRIYMPGLLIANAAHPSVRRMRSMDAELRGLPPEPAVDPRTAALRDWLAAPGQTFYATGLDAGPPPYPAIVADLQSVIGLEVRRQTLLLAPEGLHACVCARTAGMTGLGFLQPFLDVEETQLHCVDTDGPAETDEHFHGYWREHAWLRASGRVQYGPVPPAEAQAAGQMAARLENLPQDPGNAATLAKAISLAAASAKNQVVVALFVNPSEPQLPRAA